MAYNGICLGVGCGFCGWVGLFKVTGVLRMSVDNRAFH